VAASAFAQGGYRVESRPFASFGATLHREEPRAAGIVPDTLGAALRPTPPHEAVRAGRLPGLLPAYVVGADPEYLTVQYVGLGIEISVEVFIDRHELTCPTAVAP
jgi:hypothetical protein